MIKRNTFLDIFPKWLILLLPLFLITAFSNAQTISGIVTDTQGVTMPGVNILINNSTIGTTTDFDGKYSITVNSSEDVLVFRYLGMVTQEIKVGSQTKINVTMDEDMQTLSELIVVGYGTQDKKAVTGSVSVVGAEEMESRPNSQMGALIQGKVAGVQVQASSGKPSQGISMRIRGTNSINASSEPLYVIDGVPTTDTRSLSPSDIESVSVLKDASAAAIYGAQGANGVVLITTKKGSTDKPTISLDVYGGFSEVWNTQEVLNGEQFRQLMTDMGTTFNDWGSYRERTDWQNEVFQRGFTQNYQMSISGKSNKTNYYVSGGYTDVEGAVRSAEMQRANFKVNLDQEVTNWLKVGTRVNYTDYKDVDVNDNIGVDRGGVLLGTLTTPSIIGIRNPDGSFTTNPLAQAWENPLASTDGIDRGFANKRFLANFYAEATLVEGLKFKTNLGVDHNSSQFRSFKDPFETVDGRAKQGVSVFNQDNNRYFIFDNTLSYDKTIGKNKFNLLAGSVIQKYHWQSSNIERQGFDSDQISTPNAGANIIASSAWASEKANASFIGRANYDFDNKYLLTANIRVDGSSVFGPQNRWGIFPSLSAGWRISEEAFLKSVEQISDLKLRAGWGIVGNDNIAPYSYMARVSKNAPYPFTSSATPGSYPSSVENQKLKWEESEQINIGFDLGLFNDRVELTVDAYQKVTNDLLFDAPLPKSTGYNSAIQNIGSLENKGLEFNLNTVNVDKAVKWTMNMNLSLNRNKVTNLVGQTVLDGYVDVISKDNAIIIEEGLPLGSLYGYSFGGVDPETGNAYYITQNGETTFDPSPEDRKVIGDANPTFIYGFTNNVSYKNFSLSIFFQGSQGNQMLNASRIVTTSMSSPMNQTTDVLRRWQKPGDITDIPRAYPLGSDQTVTNNLISDRFIEDASYLRLKALTFSYNVPSTFLEKINLGSCRLYATGENLFTITNYSGFDPEVNYRGGDNRVMGIDFGTYPQTRTYIFGLNVSF
ncbi:SusC/RagA family TonB-linked outer membrane protein [Flammeovirga sp. MY04]|uniref:SusC/RagA family TonB-linked outer membrane protein n=1 Tax=Flammeovirga sp. MY04 TaxID=1191459 RepID=UPI00080621B6|nr:TonB-dependent receptor [Flammeovirga sp. MY04]